MWALRNGSHGPSWIMAASSSLSAALGCCCSAANPHRRSSVANDERRKLRNKRHVSSLSFVRRFSWSTLRPSERKNCCLAGSQKHTMIQPRTTLAYSTTFLSMHWFGYWNTCAKHKLLWFTWENRRLGVFILISSLPAFAGSLFQQEFSSQMQNPLNAELRPLELIFRNDWQSMFRSMRGVPLCVKKKHETHMAVPCPWNLPFLDWLDHDFC